MTDSTALVGLDELSPRLPFTLSDEEKREAQGALDDLSFDALSYGSPTWSPASVPQAVKNLILRAAARHLKNYEGYTASRAGDEQVTWAEQDSPGQATFSDEEKSMLRTMGGRTPFIGGVGQVAWGSGRVGRVGKVPVSYAPNYVAPYAPGFRPSDFPLFADDEEPW